MTISANSLSRIGVCMRRSMALSLLLIVASMLYGARLMLMNSEDWTSNNRPIARRRLRDPGGNPVVLWWTPFTGEVGANRSCGAGECFFTEDRSIRETVDRDLIVYLFYGTDFQTHDLPLPRHTRELWALLHEESPKNSFLFSHLEIMELFNFTSTFKSTSDFPLTTQYVINLDDLVSTEYFHTTLQKNEFRKRGFAPVMYVQSSCEAPSDRDAFVEQLMRFIDVDSYGACLNNKQLPQHLADPVEGMSHPDFLALTAKYKFVLSMENALCDDYMTEKLWRPLRVGSVPVYLGASKASASSWLPDAERSVVFISDFPNPRDLAARLKAIDADDAAYESFLSHKIRGSIANLRLTEALERRQWLVGHDVDARDSFVAAFECFLCDQLHQERRETRVADLSHYGCPEPRSALAEEEERESARVWRDAWRLSKYEGMATRELMRTRLLLRPSRPLDLLSSTWHQRLWATPNYLTSWWRSARAEEWEIEASSRGTLRSERLASMDYMISSTFNEEEQIQNFSSEFDHYMHMTTATEDPNKSNVVIYGRISHEELVRPLPDRINIILSRSMKSAPEGAILARSFDEAMTLVSTPPLRDSIEKVWVLGGRNIFEEALLHPWCSGICQSQIYARYECDLFFPPIDEDRFEIVPDASVPQGMQRDGDVEWEVFFWRRKDRH